VARAEAEVARLTTALDLVSTAAVIEPAPDDAPPAAWAAVVAARRAVIGVRAARERAVRDQLAAAHRATDEARAALVAARDRERRDPSARGARLHELRKYIEI